MRIKLLAFVLIFALAFGVIVTASATENKTFSLIDAATDLNYDITIKDDYAAVSLKGNTLGAAYLDDADACSVYAGVFTFYSVNEFNSVLSIYNLDVSDDSIDSLSINKNAFNSEYCFAKDKNGCIYFVADDNIKILCIYKGGTVKEVKMESQILQLLCVDGKSVIIITADSTYLYCNGEAEKLIGYPLAAPVYYAGSNILKDTNDCEYILEDGTLTEKSTVATDATAYTANSNFTSEFYFADEEVTASKIKKTFADFEITKIAKADGTVIKSGKLGTGATVTFNTGECVTVIISGELTGEGNINSRDLKAILNHLSEKELLANSALIAADADKDGKITTKDALLISQMY